MVGLVVYKNKWMLIFLGAVSAVERLNHWVIPIVWLPSVDTRRTDPGTEFCVCVRVLALASAQCHCLPACGWRARLHPHLHPHSSCNIKHGTAQRPPSAPPEVL